MTSPMNHHGLVMPKGLCSTGRPPNCSGRSVRPDRRECIPMSVDSHRHISKLSEKAMPQVQVHPRPIFEGRFLDLVLRAVQDADPRELSQRVGCPPFSLLAQAGRLSARRCSRFRVGLSSTSWPRTAGPPRSRAYCWRRRVACNPAVRCSSWRPGARVEEEGAICHLDCALRFAKKENSAPRWQPGSKAKAGPACRSNVPRRLPREGAFPTTTLLIGPALLD